MPKIYAISDLHLEFNPDLDKILFNLPEADILVLAGDLTTVTRQSDRLVTLLDRCKKRFTDVIFIAGNHEYYKCSYDIESVRSKLYEIAEQTGTIFLHRDRKVVQGVEFIGVTLWSLINRLSCCYISDFKQEVFKYQYQYHIEFDKDLEFLRDTLSTRGDQPRVVITHHLPTSGLIHSKFVGHELNSAFCTNVIDELCLDGVQLWICGHTHEFVRCNIQGTIFVANPLGYPWEKKETEISLEVYELS